MHTTQSLSGLCAHLRRVVALNCPNPLWVTAEVTQAVVSKGHMYIELAEQVNGTILAQVSAVLWQRDLRRLSQTLGPTLSALLRPGTEVRMLVRPDFHERYGLKLIVEDIDPAYTLGQWNLQRQATLQRLQETGLLQRNRTHTLAPVLQRIAVLSSETAAGLQDFRMQLAQNEAGYQFYSRFFDTGVQGNNAATELPSVLAAVAAQADRFDCVVLLRGGGARLDLAVFDTWVVCKAVAEMPLPVLTGIGHETDETLTDMVVHTALRTPTAAAAFLIQHNAVYEQQVLQVGSRISQMAQQQFYRATSDLNNMQQTLYWTARQQVQYLRRDLGQTPAVLHTAARHNVTQAAQHLSQTAERYQALHPQRILQRGFALVSRPDGQIVHQASAIQGEESLLLHFNDGQVSVTTASGSIRPIS